MRATTNLALILSSIWIVSSVAAYAQSCKGGAGGRCAQEGAVCSPVDRGSGSTGKCQSLLPKGETECDCVGNLAPPQGYMVTASAVSPSPVAAGQTGTATITVAATGGFNRDVVLSCGAQGSNSAAAPICTFAPGTNPVRGGNGTATVSFPVSPRASPGTYSYLVSGKDTGGLAPQRTTLSLPVWAAQPTGSPPYPPAGTPVLETVYIAGRVVSINSLGFLPASVLNSSPAPSALVLRIRAPWPTNLQVLAGGTPLVQIPDGATPASDDPAGYYSVKAQPMPGWPDKFDPGAEGAEWFFVSVQVFFPKPFRGVGAPSFTLTVRDVSWNAGLTGTQKTAPDLNIGIPGHCPMRTACGGPPFYPSDAPVLPSQAFSSGPDSKDDHSPPNMPRARLGIVAREVALAGWLDPANMGPNNLDSAQTEDWHYGIFLDPDFIERNYPADTPPFPANLVLPGQPERQACWAANNVWGSDSYSCPCTALPVSTDCADILPLTSGAAPSAAALLLAGNEGDSLEVELNSWHPSKHGGSLPNGWKSDTRPGFADNAWPFDPPFGTTFPANSGIPRAPNALASGDYVIITGTLWQDIAHGDQSANDPAFALNSCIDHTLHAQGGWLELHPIDTVRYVSPKPPLRKHVAVVSACGNPQANFSKTITPPFSPQPTTDGYGLKFQELQDPRFSKSVQQYLSTYVDATHKQLIAQGSINGVDDYTYYKAIEIIWWEKLGNPQLTEQLTVVPPTAKGLFNLQLDGTTWLANAGNGASTGARTTAVGQHTVAATPGAGGNSADFTIRIGGDCAQDGSINLSPGDTKTCIVTATSLAACKSAQGWMVCNGACTDVMTNDSNCGACGRSCGGQAVCKSGRCVQQSCPVGYTSCCGGDLCVRSGTKCPVCP